MGACRTSQGELSMVYDRIPEDLCSWLTYANDNQEDPDSVKHSLVKRFITDSVNYEYLLVYSVIIQRNFMKGRNKMSDRAC